MFSKIRTAVVPSVVVVLAAYGMAYAATGSPNPIDLVSSHSQAGSHAHVTPKPSHSPDVSESPDPSESPEASESPDPSESPDASHGPVRSTVGCPDGFTGNHGQFVSQSDDKQAAAQSDCGKPEQAVHSPKPTSGDDGESVGHGHEQSPEPSESPDPDSTGDQHSNGHQGNTD